MDADLELRPSYSSISTSSGCTEQPWFLYQDPMPFRRPGERDSRATWRPKRVAWVDWPPTKGGRSRALEGPIRSADDTSGVYAVVHDPWLEKAAHPPENSEL